MSMARAPKNVEVGKEIRKSKCPICGKEISEWFCPECGIPLSTNHCMRPEYKSFNEFQLCDKCHTKNPYHAIYCRNCGENMTLHAKDINKHGWVDLGLSVLWSTETMGVYCFWNSPKNHYSIEDIEKQSYLDDKRDYEDYIKKSEKKDVATYCWGNKWRTPTKEDFEELIKECKWEKCLVANQYALKAIGPNGNSIIIPINYSKLNGSFYYGLWTSSEHEHREHLAYTFRFIDWVDHLYSVIDSLSWRHMLSTEEEKNNMWNFYKQKFNEIFDFIKQMKKNKDFNFPLLSEMPFVSNLKEIEDIVTRTRKWDNIFENKRIKKWKMEFYRLGNEEKKRLWLETPVKISCDENLVARLKAKPYDIRPVADKKWQGEL